jgi:glyoxylase I family protein
MEKVTGIGGFFFRAKDPKALGLWYQQHLGVSLIPTNYGKSPWQQEARPTAFAAFKETSDYFGDSHPPITSATDCRPDLKARMAL